MAGKGDNSGASGALARWLTRVLTVLVSAGILYWFLRGEDWQGLYRAAARAALVPALLGVSVPLLVFWVTDAAFTVKSFEWFHGPVPFTDFLVVKAAFYLLTLVNLTIGTGGVFVYFLRKARISTRKQAGLLGWRVCVAVTGYLMVFTILTLATLVFYPEQAPGFRLSILLPALAAALFLSADWISFWLFDRSVVFGFLGLDRDAVHWSAFRNARAVHWLWGWCYTVPAISVNFLGMYVVARSFSIEVPFFYFAFWIPVVVGFAALPVAFGGFGTTTAAWMAFYAAFAHQTDVAAATIFIPGIRLMTRVVLGLGALPLCMRELESLYLRGSSKE